jgi:hypothetical protein
MIQLSVLELALRVAANGGDNVDDDGHGLGWLGGLVVILMIAGAVGLFFAMRRSLGRINFEEQGAAGNVDADVEETPRT